MFIRNGRIPRGFLRSTYQRIIRVVGRDGVQYDTVFAAYLYNEVSVRFPYLDQIAALSVALGMSLTLFQKYCPGREVCNGTNARISRVGCARHRQIKADMAVESRFCIDCPLLRYCKAQTTSL